MPGGEEQLGVAFADQERFGGDLGPTVRLAKEDSKVRVVLVWHAFMGYWGGVDGSSLPGYDVRKSGRLIRSGNYEDESAIEHQLVGCASWASCRAIRSRSSTTITIAGWKQQGVDGVKVDSQSAIEGVAAGLGGRWP